MREHEHHYHVAHSRQPRFFFVMLLFLGAMNGLVLFNDLTFIYFFFEVTTLCSFLLIGHDRTTIATQNALRALWMNSAGGAAFILGIIAVYRETGSLELQNILLPGLAQLGRLPAGAGTPVCGRLHQVGPVPLPELAPGGDGGADPGLRPAALEHHGQGRRLSRSAAGAGVRGHLPQPECRGVRGLQLPRRRGPRRGPEQRQEGAGLLDHQQPGSHLRLRRHQHRRVHDRRDAAPDVPRGGQGAAVPQRGGHRAAHRQPRHRGHAGALRGHAGHGADHRRRASS